LTALDIQVGVVLQLEGLAKATERTQQEKVVQNLNCNIIYLAVID